MASHLDRYCLVLPVWMRAEHYYAVSAAHYSGLFCCCDLCVSCLVVVSGARECPHDLSKRPYECTLQLFVGKLS